MGDWNPFPRPKPPRPTPKKYLSIGVSAVGGDGYLKGVAITLLASHNYYGSTGETGIARFELDYIETAVGVIIEHPGYKRVGEEHLLTGDTTNLHIVLEKQATGRDGVVHANQYQGVDNQGARLFLGHSMFWAAHAYHHDRDKLASNAEYLMKNKVDYVRIFGEVGGSSWEDVPINPPEIDYGAVIDFLYDNYALRTNLCAFASRYFSDTRAKRRQATEQMVSAILAGRQHKVIYWQTANEYGKNFPDVDELKELTDYVFSKLPNLVSSSSLATNFENFPIIGSYSLQAIHFDRTYGEDGWRYVRQPYSGREAADKRIQCEEEGVGIQSSGEQDDNPLRQGFYAATAWISLCGLKTIHTRFGVRGGAQYDVDHFGPWQNYWEQPNMQAIMDATNYVRDTMPVDVVNWPEYNGNKQEHLLPAEHSWPDGYDNGVTRTYMALGPNTFVMLPYGIKQYSKHTAKVNMHIIVHDIMQRKIIDEKDLSAGQEYTFMGQVDSNAGYLVIGVF